MSTKIQWANIHKSTFTWNKISRFFLEMKNGSLGIAEFYFKLNGQCHVFLNIYEIDYVHHHLKEVKKSNFCAIFPCNNIRNKFLYLKVDSIEYVSQPLHVFHSWTWKRIAIAYKRETESLKKIRRNKNIVMCIYMYVYVWLNKKNHISGVRVPNSTVRIFLIVFHWEASFNNVVAVCVYLHVTFCGVFRPLRYTIEWPILSIPVYGIFRIDFIVLCSSCISVEVKINDRIISTKNTINSTLNRFWNSISPVIQSLYSFCSHKKT